MCIRDRGKQNSADFILRPFSITDASSFAFYGNNPKIACFLRDAFPYPYRLKDAQDYIQSCIASEGKTQLCRAIVVDGAAVGSIGLFFGKDVAKKSAELGYWLGEPFWGKHIVSRGIGELCREAFCQTDLIRIYAQPFVHNLASRHALENNGFRLEGILQNSIYKSGMIYDSCMYALLK